MKSWVTPHLSGGLGNRLFQFAAAMGAAEKWNVPCIFHEKTTQKNDHGPADTIYKLYPTVPVVKQSDPWFILSEEKGGFYKYEPFEETMPFSRLLVDGWRQTEKYFPKQFSLQPHWEAFLTPEKQDELLKTYGLDSPEKRKQSWFLHIRLGDYKVLPHHQIQATDYYIKAFEHIPRGSRVLLCSDEVHLCGQWVEAMCKKHGLEFVPCLEIEEIPSLWLMSQCKGGAIVANSTFSWWGAYFTRLTHPDPSSYKAYFPAVWGHGMPPATDIIPEWGTRIEF